MKDIGPEKNYWKSLQKSLMVKELKFRSLAKCTTE